jgi:predicted aspartyl protease
MLLSVVLVLLGASSCRTSMPPAGRHDQATASSTVVVGQAARPVGLHRSWGNGLVILDAAVIGRNTHRQRVDLVVDTGAEISGLLETAAIGLPEGWERVEVHTLHGGSLDGTTVKGGVFPWPVALEPGVLESMPETSFVVFPGSANLPGKTNGLLGADFLLSERIAVDLGGARLLPSPASVPAPRDSWVRLDLLAAAGRGNPLHFLRMKVGGETFTCLVDSGAERSLLTREAAMRLGIKVSRSGQNTQLVDAGGGRVSLGRAKLKNPTWGAYRIPSFGVGVAPMGNLRRLRTMDGGSVDGVLGLDFLERYSAIIDLPARALWVRLP